MGRFVLVKQAPAPIPIPAGVRAAFPLECLGGRPACVISADALDSPSGYPAILHEFVHCHQLESCELELKNRLRIARDADSRADYMWELNYPFRYSDPRFVGLYRSFLEALQQCDEKGIWRCREQLSALLPDDQYEYMVWQEWKEGLARFIENLVRRKMALPENHHGREEPFDRVVFYEGGASFVGFLDRQEPGITVEIARLFDRMFQRPG